MTEAAPEWPRLLRALSALAVDPRGLKGATIRVRAGPVRQALDTVLAALPGPKRRIHPALSDTELFGGLDVAASIAAGCAVHADGLAARPCLLILPMAERTDAGLAARLAQVLDADLGHRLILLDESDGAEPGAPAGLRERLAFAADLTGLRHTQVGGGLPVPSVLEAARRALRTVRVRSDDPDRLTIAAAQFGIDSLRAPQLALRTACALAAVDGHAELTDDDVLAAAELVYPDRATRIPEDQSEPPQEQDQTHGNDDHGGDGGGLPDEMLIEAVKACLPPELLARLMQDGATRSATGSGAGARQKANRRGRPRPSRPGRADGNARIDILATLRAAAPWQTIRAKARSGAQGFQIRPSDIRLRRYEDRSDRLLVFLVDASGSAAMARLAEAKGAVELLLGQAYSRRDQVALISFRGAGSDCLLPATRSLVQAKRRLSELPGGGGTPLAAGLQHGLATALQARMRGLSPALILLTDGKANVTLDGMGDRTRAASDSTTSARRCAAEGIPSIVIDIASRPSRDTEPLALAMRGSHIPLPRADAAGISRAVSSAFAE